jgi:hypothetical protein
MKILHSKIIYNKQISKIKKTEICFENHISEFQKTKYNNKKQLYKKYKIILEKEEETIIKIQENLIQEMETEKNKNKLIILINQYTRKINNLYLTIIKIKILLIVDYHKEKNKILINTYKEISVLQNNFIYITYTILKKLKELQKNNFKNINYFLNWYKDFFLKKNIYNKKQNNLFNTKIIKKNILKSSNIKKNESKYDLKYLLSKI